jgi:alpha-N-arabinofuranosidase
MKITPDGDYVNASLIPDTGSDGHAMEDGLFGLNAEITRKGFFGGLSAEMLNNRKLLMGQEGAAGWSCFRARRVTDRSHESLCNSHFVVLEDGGVMSQCSDVIALQTGRRYEARAWVKAYSQTAEITLGVAGMEQAFTIAADGEPYRELIFTFEGKDVERGTFSVSARGEVAVYELSLLPADHFYGMRRDVIDSLRALAPTAIRYPGGCFADHFLWRECLKAPAFRIPVDGSAKDFMLRDTYGQDPMDIGLNEFMMLCREIGAEPEFTVSILQSDGADARDLIEYCNGSGDTAFGAIRQSLGFDAFDIRTWYVGNEVYYFGARYRNDAVAAAKRTGEIVNAMRSVDPDIRVVLGVVADDDLRQWSFDFLANLTCTYEMISHHRYNGTAPNAEPDGKTACDNLESSFKDDTEEGLEFYKHQLFRDTFDTTRICVDEWNFCWGSGSNNALVFSNALEFHFFARAAKTYHVREARFFMPVNEGMITVTGTESRIESSGELIRLMAGHRGGRVIPCAADTEELDILCTEHEGGLFVSVVNRGSTPYCLQADGYTASACREIRVKDFSFFSNDYEIVTGDSAIVHGHSVLFLSLKK